LDYGSFQHPPSALFRDYLGGSPSAAPFFAGGRWDLEALLQKSEGALALARPRGAVAEALARQQEARGNAGAAARARELARPDAVAVVTGQQAGLFGGPLFVLYKALGALKVADLLRARRAGPVVPVFWVASDDHDFAEVRSATVLDESGQLHTVRYNPHQEPLGEPASRIVLDDTMAALVEELRGALPATPFRDEVLATLAACYRPGATLAGAFAAFVSTLLPELVVLDPDDPALKAAMAPVMERELVERSPTSRLAEEIGPRLLAAGYHQQVAVRPGFLNLFVVTQRQRRSLAARNGDLEIRGVGERLTVDEAARRLRQQPGEWSPGVLLRPLAQDFILPTAAYVGGPAEIAYHAQIGPSYPHFGIPRGLLLPRPSVTLLEPAQARALEAEALTLPELQTDSEALLSRWAREAYPDVEEAFTRARGGLQREMAAVEEALGRYDPTLKAAA
ncbi:MAG TPA: bacillithiol biosynthesis cysteine-adding enzyme BshC, partial [Planctomycetota bacterium]|nr:bacillithiol biosynthesis cysteine-adding enzyme BshC [Planctomycetota bacterium]